MRRVGLLIALALLRARAHAAETVAPTATVSPDGARGGSLPLAVAPSLPLGGGIGSLAPLDWRQPQSPAALAAQLFLPPSAIMNFAGQRAGAEAMPAFAQGDARAQAQTAPGRARSLSASGNALPAGTPAPAGESGMIPIEALGEGSRLPNAAQPQQRLTDTESALRAPLGELHDAPADGGESLHALSSRVWDLVSGRNGSVSRASAARDAFGALNSQGAARAAASAALPTSAAQAPLDPASVAALPAPAPSSPAALALVLMDVVEQKLSLTASVAVPRLEAGQAVRPMRAQDVPAPYLGRAPLMTEAALASNGSSAALRANDLPEGAQGRAPNADLPSFAWRAEAEMVSFGEAGPEASRTASAPQAGEAAALPPSVSEVMPRPLERTSAQPAQAAPRSVPAPRRSKRVEAALPYALLVTALGAALLAWPERR